MILNTDKTLPTNSRNLSKQFNVLPVFNITEHTVLVQSVYVKQVSWRSLYLSATLKHRANPKKNSQKTKLFLAAIDEIVLCYIF